MKNRKLSVVQLTNKINAMNKFEHYIISDLCGFDTNIVATKLREFVPELKLSKNKGLVEILTNNITESTKKISNDEAINVLTPFYDKYGSSDELLEKMILSSL